MSSVRVRLQTIREEAPDPEAERIAIKQLKTAEVVDSDYHKKVALWAEELGELTVALREWNLALRDNHQDLEVVSRLLDIYTDLGELEKALRFSTRLTAAEPTSVEFWRQRIALERDLGRYEAASDSRNRAYLLTEDIRFRGPEEEPVPGVSEETQFDDPFLILLQELFCGREGVYARQWVDSEGRTGYSPIREPLTLKVIRNHLNGNHTVGIYPLRMDNTVHFAVLDFDLSHVVVNRCHPGSVGWNEAMDSLLHFCSSVQEQAASDGVTLHAANSGYKGRHLWMFFSEPVPARLARNYLKSLTAPLALPPVVQCEIFPKQSSLPLDKLGNLIKMPLGIHRKTDQRVWFNEPEKTWASQCEWLQTVTKVSKETLRQAFHPEPEFQVSQSVSNTQQTDDTKKEPTVTSTGLEIVWEPDYQLETDVELQTLLSRCVTLRTVVENVRQTADISHDEARVLIHTVGHLETGPQAINMLLSRAMVADSSLYLKRPLRGNPMSCAKIRSRIPETTSQLPCDCTFARTAGLYPTPTLHLDEKNSGNYPLDHFQFQALIQDFLRMKKEAFK